MSPVSRYEVIRELGRGGMGIVYLAQDTLLKRQVVMKTVLPPPDQNQDPDQTQAIWDVMLQRRFIREAQAAASLNHANLVAVYDILGGGTSV